MNYYAYVRTWMLEHIHFLFGDILIAIGFYLLRPLPYTPFISLNYFLYFLFKLRFTLIFFSKEFNILCKFNIIVYCNLCIINTNWMYACLSKESNWKFKN